MVTRLIDRDTRTYDAGDGFLVDIVRLNGVSADNELYEAWIYHKDYGIKSLMFSVSGVSSKDFEEMVVANLNDYIDGYREEVIEC